jgi:phosphatidylcholine synthase
VPIRYLYPSRTPVLRPLTVGLGMVWAGTMLWVLWHLEQPPHALVLGSLAYPLYYVALSLALSSTDR